MKQFALVCIFLGFASQAFAQLDEKQLAGSWNYIVETEQGPMTGILNFVSTEDGLSGKVTSDDGQSWVMDALEIIENNSLNFVITPQGETFKTNLIFKGKTFTGTSGPSYAPYKVSGVKARIIK